MSSKTKYVQGLSPEAYVSPDIARLEDKHVFQKHWYFVGFRSDVAAHNDFLSLKIGGVPVVVQNFSGELRAFSNICTHRRSTLQMSDCGNRKLSCPYHGWTFNKDGLPIGIPDNENSFGIDKANLGHHALTSYALESCGNFVFVRIAPQGEELKAFLGENWGVLEHLSKIITDKIASQKKPWKANWKIGVESVLEIYHLGPVHPVTFKNFAKSRWDCAAHGRHSTGHTDLSDKAKSWWDGVQRKLALKKSEKYNEYNHFFIYPNIAIGLTNGSLMSVQTYDPTGIDSCDLHYRLFLAAPEGEKTGAAQKALRRAAVQSLVAFNDQVLEEDRLVSEGCHANMKHVTAPAILGMSEIRLRDFHENLRDDYGVKNG